MTQFNYRNAYRLAVQTNRELHASIDAYRELLDAAKTELAHCYERINELEIENQLLKHQLDLAEKHIMHEHKPQS